MSFPASLAPASFGEPLLGHQKDKGVSSFCGHLPVKRSHPSPPDPSWRMWSYCARSARIRRSCSVSFSASCASSAPMRSRSSRSSWPQPVFQKTGNGRSESLGTEVISRKSFTQIGWMPITASQRLTNHIMGEIPLYHRSGVKPLIPQPWVNYRSETLGISRFPRKTPTNVLVSTIWLLGWTAKNRDRSKEPGLGMSQGKIDGYPW